MRDSNTPASLAHLSLGKASQYIDQYSPELLQPVPRSLNRKDLGIVEQQPFSGVDIWNGYELSWLNPKGKPCVAVLQAIVPADSPNLIESKSFKLYLNSFNQWKVDNAEQLRNILHQDLSRCAGTSVEVKLFSLDDRKAFQVHPGEGELLDNLDIEVTQYQPQSDILKCGHTVVKRHHISHLLKSNCLITQQPDWGSVNIHYHGREILPESLLRYLITFRQHNEFHEQCVERIFCDILNQCHPDKLSVYARYTRRGGLDISPFRSNFEQQPKFERLLRQ
ncbi:NADPH-dependent 7-cyano-7-deazaguanine reductase QueF [Lacimicrobium alkaliphilum]|uniref:NADPH-dependent 7-cyano-7-deazaguanine reductase n=1 Tax=Lacimicrobium alkaliphilum TaxID=1526571 RepID=A0ABQ1RFS5_9ALTE|nr:NADPH-dependent 7-cyano-7-deazaguanine reductase QueF [Lacimicrobium alkaliphilum]GGD66977.1 NADPH-dependent 7-cyano-7-deazaguanine reductase [Lacimicrobium alkaliphilum]